MLIWVCGCAQHLLIPFQSIQVNYTVLWSMLFPIITWETAVKVRPMRWWLFRDFVSIKLECDTFTSLSLSLSFSKFAIAIAHKCEYFSWFNFIDFVSFRFDSQLDHAISSYQGMYSYIVHAYSWRIITSETESKNNVAVLLLSTVCLSLTNGSFWEEKKRLANILYESATQRRRPILFGVATAAAATTIITIPHLVIAVKQQLHIQFNRTCMCVYVCVSLCV